MNLSSVIGDLVGEFIADLPKMTMRAVNSSDLDDRVSHLCEMIDKGIQDPRIRQLASKILIERNVPAKDGYAEIEAIFNFVREYIRYTKDPEEYELFQTPQRTLQMRIGDCDDMAILLSALLLSIGHICILRVIGVTRNQPEHIYPVVLLYNQDDGSDMEIALDATRPEPMGWEVPEETIKFNQDYEIE